VSRWHVALFLLVALAGTSAVLTYAAAPPRIVGTAKFPITVKAGDYDLLAQVAELPAGSMFPKHTHGGPVVVQVITGQITIVDASGEKTVKAGGMFTEIPGVVHWAVNRGPVTTRLAVSYLIPKGAEVITFVK